MKQAAMSEMPALRESLISPIQNSRANAPRHDDNVDAVETLDVGSNGTRHDGGRKLIERKRVVCDERYWDRWRFDGEVPS